MLYCAVYCTENVVQYDVGQWSTVSVQHCSVHLLYDYEVYSILVWDSVYSVYYNKYTVSSTIQCLSLYIV